MHAMLDHFSEYMPHGMCLLWEPWLLALWIGSDSLIVAAYFAIPFALLQVLRKRNDIRQRGLVTLFAAFILLCGVTHMFSILTLWVPVYPLMGAVKLATGLVSATTAVMLFRLVPALVAIPSLDSLAQSNEKLRAEVASHGETLNALREARDALELKVAERTAELQTVNARLSIAAREAIHRSHNLIAVVSSMARQSSRDQTDVAEFTKVLIGRLNALASATGAVIQDHGRASVELKDVVTKQLQPVIQTYPEKVTVTGPGLQIDTEAAQQISLAVHELATNAQKYGSLASDGAAISVTYSLRKGTDDDDHLVFIWQEDLSSAPGATQAVTERSGFGTRLLTQIIPSMLNGAASRTLRDGRLIYELDVPLSAIVPDQSRTLSEAFVTDIVDGSFANT